MGCLTPSEIKTKNLLKMALIDAMVFVYENIELWLSKAAKMAIFHEFCFKEGAEMNNVTIGYWQTRPFTLFC